MSLTNVDSWDWGPIQGPVTLAAQFRAEQQLLSMLSNGRLDNDQIEAELKAYLEVLCPYTWVILQQASLWLGTWSRREQGKTRWNMRQPAHLMVDFKDDDLASWFSVKHEDCDAIARVANGVLGIEHVSILGPNFAAQGIYRLGALELQKVQMGGTP